MWILFSAMMSAVWSATPPAPKITVTWNNTTFLETWEPNWKDVYSCYMYFDVESLDSNSPTYSISPTHIALALDCNNPTWTVTINPTTHLGQIKLDLQFSADFDYSYWVQTLTCTVTDWTNTWIWTASVDNNYFI